MQPIIQVTSMGQHSKPYVDDILALRSKIESEGIRFEDVRAYEAFDQILITVIGVWPFT